MGGMVTVTDGGANTVDKNGGSVLRQPQAGHASGPGSLCPPNPARHSRAALIRLFGFQFLLSPDAVA